MTILRISTIPLLLAIFASLIVSRTTAVAQDVLDMSDEQSPEVTLNIGSKAPDLDIEHWIQDGNGKLKPFKTFEPGRIYVIEFWATWCGPCIQSMPMLAELQQKYGDSVRLVSVTDETLDEVNDLLQQTYPNTEKSFEEITSPYSLTADPDGSTYKTYMVAAGLNGIPTAFVVGKTGVIEWIGHAAMAEEPIEALLADKWDREAEKLRRDREMERETILRKMAGLARQGNYDAAAALLADQIAATPEDQDDEKTFWVATLNGLKMSAGKLDDEAIEFYRSNIKDMSGDARSLIQFAISLYNNLDNGGDAGPLTTETDAALAELEQTIEPELKPLYYNSRALLSIADSELKTAIGHMQSAADVATGKQKERFEQFIASLEAEIERQAEEEAESKSESQK